MNTAQMADCRPVPEGNLLKIGSESEHVLMRSTNLNAQNISSISLFARQSSGFDLLTITDKNVSF